MVITTHRDRTCGSVFIDSARSHRLPLGGWPGRGPAIVNLAVKGVSNALYIAGCYNQELKAIHIY